MPNRDFQPSKNPSKKTPALVRSLLQSPHSFNDFLAVSAHLETSNKQRFSQGFTLLFQKNSPFEFTISQKISPWSSIQYQIRYSSAHSTLPAHPKLPPPSPPHLHQQHAKKTPLSQSKVVVIPIPHHTHTPHTYTHPRTNDRK